MSVGGVDQDMQGAGQEGAGTGGNWMKALNLKINEDAEGVSMSIPPYFRRFDGLYDEECPSIFMQPRRMANHQVAVDVARGSTGVAAQTPAFLLQPPDHTSRGSTGGNVIVAAVGPYHDHRSESALVTHAKKCAIVEFFARKFGFDSVHFLGWAVGNDARARRCYERGTVTMDPEQLAKILLLDGCLVLFAVFLLRSSVREDGRPAALARSAEYREVFTYLSADISLHMKQTRLDLLLLSNQIPFFVLAELHRRLSGTFFDGIHHSIEELALSCFNDIRPSSSGFIKQGGDAGTVHHLLHLFHRSRVPRGKHAIDTSSILLDDPETNIPCATWLEDSLSSFSKHAAAPGSSSLDVVFERRMFGARGVLRVPKLHIHDYSELVFRNLIAFEQSHLRCGLGVTAYCICMAGLLNDEDDAKLLRKSGILAHTYETDKEIVDLFKGLADEYRDTFYSRELLVLCKAVGEHRHRTAAARAVIKSVVLQCFPKQSVTFFVILAAFISFATLINTIYSVIRFYHPVKQ